MMWGSLCTRQPEKYNISEKRSGREKKVQSYVEVCTASSKHRKKLHPYQSSNIEASKIQGSGSGLKYKV